MSGFIPGPLQKRCPNCNRLFGPKKLKNGRFEYPSIFKKKVHCSLVCGGVAAAMNRKLAKAEKHA